MRDKEGRKEERRKQGHTNNKTKQHSTPKAVTFPKLPWMGLEPTTLSRQSALPPDLLLMRDAEGRKQEARSCKSDVNFSYPALRTSRSQFLWKLVATTSDLSSRLRSVRSLYSRAVRQPCQMRLVGSQIYTCLHTWIHTLYYIHVHVFK